MLEKYLWHIFQVAEAAGVDIDTGIDMMARDLDTGSRIYTGVIDGDTYSTARTDWEATDHVERYHDVARCGSFVREHYAALCTAFAARDQEAFERIVRGE